MDLRSSLAFILASAMGAAALAQVPSAAPPADFIVFFDWAKPDINRDAAEILDKAASQYSAQAGSRIVLAGHSDRSGPAGANLRSSRKRAEAVRDYLTAHGVPAGAVTLHAYGEQRPIVETEDGVREVQNRRVEIVIQEADGGDARAVRVPRVVPLIDGSGTVVGQATMDQQAIGWMLRLSVTGMSPGIHGVHLHEVGTCEGPSFKSAGAHWNPTARQHGHNNPQGAHWGDLANVEVGASGEAATSIPLTGTTGPNPLADADGTSLVVHAKADDYKTDPSGNSGDRIACAVLAPPRP